MQYFSFHFRRTRIPKEEIRCFLLGAPPPIVINVDDEKQEVLEFRDTWDYKAENRSKIPLLSEMLRNHTLPPGIDPTVSRYYLCLLYLE